MKEPVGKQDQFIAAVGGVTCFRFNPDGHVEYWPLRATSDTLRRLEQNLLLFFTGEERSAAAILSDQAKRSAAGEEEMTDNLHRTKELGRRSCELLEAGELEAYAELMHEHWENKRKRSSGMTSERIDTLYTLARRSGAIGGKLVGAGGGGFLLVYATRPDDTRLAKIKEDMRALRTRIEIEREKLKLMPAALENPAVKAATNKSVDDIMAPLSAPATKPAGNTPDVPHVN